MSTGALVGGEAQILDDDKLRYEATFRYEVTNVSQLSTTTSYSEKCYVRGLSWRIGVRTREKDNTKYLSFHVYCSTEPETEIPDWSCDVHAVLRLVAQKGGVANFKRKIDKLFNKSVLHWGFSEFLAWNTVCDPDKDYVKDDVFICEVSLHTEKRGQFRRKIEEIKEKRTDGFEIIPLRSPMPPWGVRSYAFAFDASGPDRYLDDVTLICQDKSFKCHRLTLSQKSTTFRTMFTGDFAEINKKEIVIQDITSDTMLEILRCIYCGYVETDLGKASSEVQGEFLYAAGKYDLKVLFDLLTVAFDETLDASTACRYLMLADSFHMVSLKALCFAVMAKSANRDGVLKSPEWNQYASNAQLVEEFYRFDGMPAGALVGGEVRKLADDKLKYEATFRHEVTNVTQLSKTTNYSDKSYVRGLSWRIGVCTGEKDKTKYLSFYVYCSTEPETEIPDWACNVHAVLRLIAQKDGVANFEMKLDKLFNKSNPAWGYLEFLAWNKVCDPDKGYVKDDVLICEVSLHEEKRGQLLRKIQEIKEKRTDGFEIIPHRSRMPPWRVRGYTFALVASGSDPSRLSDVTLICQGKSFNCHRLTLSQKSTTFRTMFTGDFAEINKKEIIIQDITSDTMLEILRCIYCGYVETDLGKASSEVQGEFLYAAGKYDLKVLFDLLTVAFDETLDASTACRYLMFADSFHMASLKTLCFSVMAKSANREGVVKSPEWKQYASNAQLVEEFYRFEGV